jgi:hypothetical protein
MPAMYVGGHRDYVHILYIRMYLAENFLLSIIYIQYWMQHHRMFLGEDNRCHDDRQ